MSVLTKKWGVICRVKRTIYKAMYKERLRIDSSVTFRNGFHILIENEATVLIGHNVFFNNDCSINAMNSIVIGNNCLFGENVKIYDHNHRFRDNTIPISEQGFSVAKIEIGDNCWIGTNVVVLKGAKIGNHCVIAAGTIVDFYVPDETILFRDGSMKEIIQ